ncbi:MAG: exopolyphosphatase [Cyclobacteriaceae bacterium]
MKIAVIDMGTNTFHLMLAEVMQDSAHIFHKERVAVKIGEKGINQGRITEEAWLRAVDTISGFKKKIEQSEISTVFATATSAIRNATNGVDLTKEIERKTGIQTQIISGEREAQLILEGARHALDLGSEKHLLMDIGGGSIEFIIADKAQTFWLKSFEVGGQRLVEKFHHSDPIAPTELNDLDAYFMSELAELIEQCQIHKPRTLVGCSGTFDTLSDMYCATKNLVPTENQTELPLSISAFNDIYKQLISKTRADRLVMPGMVEMRVDMIVVATALIHYLIKTLNITNLRVSAYALKEGVLFNTIASVRNSKKH